MAAKITTRKTRTVPAFTVTAADLAALIEGVPPDAPVTFKSIESVFVDGPHTAVTVELPS